METNGEIYTGYEWHAVDPESGRIILYVQNRRDHPGGETPIDFPGVTILEYAGSGRFRLEEDFYSTSERDAAMKAYAEACARVDPDHPRKPTRWDWGSGPGAGAPGPTDPQPGRPHGRPIDRRVGQERDPPRPRSARRRSFAAASRCCRAHSAAVGERRSSAQASR